MATDLNSLFRLSGPSQADIDAFHNDGYIVFADVFTDGAREYLIKEIEELVQVRKYVRELESHRGEPKAYFIRPWNARGRYTDQLIDDPFIASLLRATIGDDYHFCHSALNIAPRGIGPIRYHQDHHHWKHENAVNLAERDRYYVQILYYLNGFTHGDRNLKVIPGQPSSGADPGRDTGTECLPARSTRRRVARSGRNDSRCRRAVWFISTRVFSMRLRRSRQSLRNRTGFSISTSSRRRVRRTVIRRRFLLNGWRAPTRRARSYSCARRTLKVAGARNSQHFLG